MIFLTEDLTTSIKRRSLVPISQQTFQDSDLIAFANEEMGINLIPEIQKVREDLFLKSIQIPVVAGKYRYPMPERSIGNAVKSVVIVTGDNNSYELPRIDVSKSINGGLITGRADSFYIEDSYIALNPTPSTGTTLEVWYYSRPNKLVPTTQCGKVTAISNVSGTVTMTVDTNLVGSLAIGDKVDVISGKSPLILWAEDAVITNITSTTIEVATTSVDDESGSVNIIVGDYICAAKTSNIPMIPEEFHPILAQMVSARLLEGLGDLNKLNACLAKLNEMKSNAIALISNRVENSVEYFNNRSSILNSSWRVGNRSVNR